MDLKHIQGMFCGIIMIYEGPRKSDEVFRGAVVGKDQVVDDPPMVVHGIEHDVVTDCKLFEEFTDFIG